MRYRTGRTGAVATRELDPYRVWYRSGGLYVVGLDHKSGEVRTFAVERIREIETSGERFDAPDDFDFDAYIGSSFGVIAEPAIIPCGSASTRTGRPTSANAPGTRASSSSPSPADGVLLSMEVGGASELRSWVLSFGPGAEVLEPESLRAGTSLPSLDAAAKHYHPPRSRRRTDRRE